MTQGYKRSSTQDTTPEGAALYRSPDGVLQKVDHETGQSQRLVRLQGKGSICEQLGQVDAKMPPGLHLGANLVHAGIRENLSKTASFSKPSSVAFIVA